MRRILMLVLTAILIVLTYFVVTSGISIGDIRILSWGDLVNKNDELDANIEELDKTISVTFPTEQEKLKNSYKQLQSKKEEYADLVLYSSKEEIEKATRTEIYETEFLWTKLGNYATKNNGTDMKIEVVKGNSSQTNVYNLNFTMIGDYVHISDFISAVENDPRLGFKIEKFRLIPSTSTSTSTSASASNSSSNTSSNTEENVRSNLLKATFTVENVGLNIKETEVRNSQEETSDRNIINETENTNTTKETTSTTKGTASSTINQDDFKL